MFWSKWEIEEVIDVEMLIIDDVVEEDIGGKGMLGCGQLSMVTPCSLQAHWMASRQRRQLGVEPHGLLQLLKGQSGGGCGEV